MQSHRQQQKTLQDQSEPEMTEKIIHRGISVVCVLFFILCHIVLLSIASQPGRVEDDVGGILNCMIVFCNFSISRDFLLGTDDHEQQQQLGF